MTYLIEIEVEYESGKTPKKGIDLSEELAGIGIDPMNPDTTYNASYNPQLSESSFTEANQQYSQASGGQIFPPQQIIHNRQIKFKPTSFNIKGRFDDKEDMWNIDVYIHINDGDLDVKDKRLLKRHIKGVHKVPNSSWIKINWWLNGIQQESIYSKKDSSR